MGNILIGLSKKIMPKKVMEKIQISKLGTLPAHDPWVKEWIDLNDLPEFLGGKLADADLPPEVRGDYLVDEEDDLYTNLTVYARSDSEIRVPIQVEDCTVGWSVKVESYGINFAARYEEGTPIPIDEEVPEGYVPDNEIVLREPGKIKA